MERSSLSRLRSYLATAASCAAIALSVGYVAESLSSFAYKDPIKHSRALFYTAFYTAVWVAKDAASFSLKRRKLRIQEKQRIADNTSHLSLYIAGLHENPVYPISYISLVESFSNPKRFLFKEGKEGVCGYVDPITREIVLLQVNNNENITTKSSTLLHELTHALRSESFPDPRELDYLSYMRENLQEECVAVSSETYGCTELLANGKFPKISMLDQKQQRNINFFSKDIRNLMNPASCFPFEDKKILIAAIIHSMVAQSVYQTSNFWWTHYTEGYNYVHGTDHQPPDNGFEVPLLPPTLARQVSDVFDRIFQRIPEDQRHAHPFWQHWMSMTGIDLDTLKLAAAQTTWPTYPSEVLTGMNSGQNTLG